MHNTRGYVDARHLLTGKDGVLYDELGNMLAQVEEFTVKTSWENADYQPCGDAQKHKVWTAYSVTLSFTQALINEDERIRDVFTAFQSGQPVRWTFQGTVYGRNGSEQRYIYRQCVPDGDIDLQGINPGEIVKRQWNLFVNEPPELQSELVAVE